MVEFQRGPGLGIFEWKQFYDDVRARLSDVVRQDYALQLLDAAIISTSSVGMSEGSSSVSVGVGGVGDVVGGSARRTRRGFASLLGSARRSAAGSASSSSSSSSAFRAALGRASSDGGVGERGAALGEGGEGYGRLLDYSFSGNRRLVAQGTGIDLGVGLVRSKATGGRTWLLARRNLDGVAKRKTGGALTEARGGEARRRGRAGLSAMIGLKAVSRSNTCPSISTVRRRDLPSLQAASQRSVIEQCRMSSGERQFPSSSPHSKYVSQSVSQSVSQ